MHVELIARSDRYTREMRRATSATDKLRSGFMGLRNAMLLVTGATGFGIAVRRTFELGAAVEETGSKFRTVFGTSADAMDDFIARWGTLAGLSRTQAREITATTGAIVQGMGLAQAASATYAEAVTRLAGDLSSFNNIPIAETSRAIQAAITGERESLKRLGVVILETDVQKRALLDTGKLRVEQLTQEEKAVATLAIITERAGVAIGDLSRTQDSAANRARRLAAEFRDIREALASAVLPVFEVFMREIENMLGGTATFVQWLQTSGPIMAAWAEVGVAAFGAVANAVSNLVSLVTGLGRLLLATAQALVAFFNPFGDWQTFRDAAARIEEAWVGLGGTFMEVGEGVIELYDRIRIAMNTFGETTLEFVRPALDATADTAAVAADELNRLVDALNKYNAASSFLGGLSRIPGLGFLSGLSNVAGIFGGVLNPLSSVLGAFGGGKAAGGPVSSGTAYMVGERGPEMFVPSQSGTIVPNGGISISFSFPPAKSPSDAARDPEIARMFAEQVRNALENGMAFA
jgi:hypothetical protein